MEDRKILTINTYKLENRITLAKKTAHEKFSSEHKDNINAMADTAYRKIDIIKRVQEWVKYYRKVTYYWEDELKKKEGEKKKIEVDVEQKIKHQADKTIKIKEHVTQMFKSYADEGKKIEEYVTQMFKQQADEAKEIEKMQALLKEYNSTIEYIRNALEIALQTEKKYEQDAEETSKQLLAFVELLIVGIENNERSAEIIDIIAADRPLLPIPSADRPVLSIPSGDRPLSPIPSADRSVLPIPSAEVMGTFEHKRDLTDEREKDPTYTKIENFFLKQQKQQGKGHNLYDDINIKKYLEKIL